ncbi:hypothetical protein HYH03_001161 [Edaphochlamys debaryana]|uniref:Uncharacterized protein n=1 Tax=Edaphochlamys debaryana TaxID=47281 RepID=A0A836C5M6_9CHLO|nr:hypothetical protein HYH03_001161 [Edaphochlamys debaryana]|eukprot:KAG2501371.1 hypothetical protein HYH03_001161 [Edaphochlamys debaryana]
MDAGAQRPLVEGLPGQGPPADPTTAVQFNPALLAKCWPPKLGEQDAPRHRSRAGASLRLVSKDARAAFDAACQEPLVYRLEQAGYEQEGGGRASPSQALGWALGMLRRGRRPTAVCIVDDEEAHPRDWQHSLLDLLRAIPQLSGSPGEAVSSLQLPPELLSRSTAPLIAGAFPNLASLELGNGHKLNPRACFEAARGLALLLGVRSAPEGGGSFWDMVCGDSWGGGGGAAWYEDGGASSDEEGAAAGSGYNVFAGGPHGERALWGVGGAAAAGAGDGVTVLRQHTQLRSLQFESLMLFGSDEGEPEWDDREPVEELTPLTHLTALSLRACAPSLLPALTAALTRLTSLALSYHSSNLPLSPSVFAPLQGLQRLEIPRTSLEVAELAEALSSLTRLSVGGFTLPAQELSQPLTSIPRWRLPAGLWELGLGIWGDFSTDSRDDYLEALAGLELPRGLCFDQESRADRFTLRPGRHTGFPNAEDELADELDSTALLPAAEEALCGALSFVRQHGLLKSGLRISFEAKEADRLLQPVGGAAGMGPGRPNYGRWLREVGALGLTRLTLKGICLSYQDVETMRDGLENLELLHFEPPCQLPPPALPLLAGLPHLKEVTLDATPWAGGDPASTELRDQVLESLVALARARPEGRRLALHLFYRGWGCASDRERVRSLANRLREQVPALEVSTF